MMIAATLAIIIAVATSVVVVRASALAWNECPERYHGTRASTGAMLPSASITGAHFCRYWAFSPDHHPLQAEGDFDVGDATRLAERFNHLTPEPPISYPVYGCKEAGQALLIRFESAEGTDDVGITFSACGGVAFGGISYLFDSSIADCLYTIGDPDRPGGPFPCLSAG